MPIRMSLNNGACRSRFERPNWGTKHQPNCSTFRNCPSCGIMCPNAECARGDWCHRGSITPTAIITAAFGMDVTCGMNALRLSLQAQDLPDNPARHINFLPSRQDQADRIT